ncbi:MAG: sporulation transcriptional regulator SpoIIID [Clostridia bacterium]|nr:sporulation transcriptional regulator SpoIIID [Clostridia bacterium]
MHYKLKNRILAEAEYIVKYGATVRKTAKIFGVGKSTVHKDMVSRLKPLSIDLYEKVKLVLEKNLLERHVRGGLATKNKYLIKKSLKKHNL